MCHSTRHIYDFTGCHSSERPPSQTLSTQFDPRILTPNWRHTSTKQQLFQTNWFLTTPSSLSSPSFHFFPPLSSTLFPPHPFPFQFASFPFLPRSFSFPFPSPRPFLPFVFPSYMPPFILPILSTALPSSPVHFHPLTLLFFPFHPPSFNSSSRFLHLL